MAVSKRCKELWCLFYSGLLLVSGILLIVASVYFGYKLVYHFKFVPSECIAPFILIFLLAFIHILLTWVGVNGSRREHMFHVVLFIIITVVLVILEMTVAIWTMILWSKVGKKSFELMTNSFQGFVKDSYDKADWLRLQSKLQCCGINNVSDYSVIGSSSGSIPISCCNTTTATTCPAIYQQGCSEPLTEYVKKLLRDIALVGFGSGLFQVLGIVAFFYFYKAVKQEMAAQAAVRRASRIQEGNPLNRRNSKVQRKNTLPPKPPSGSVA